VSALESIAKNRTFVNVFLLRYHCWQFTVIGVHVPTPGVDGTGGALFLSGAESRNIWLI